MSNCPTTYPCPRPAFPSPDTCEANHIHCTDCGGVIARVATPELIQRAKDCVEYKGDSIQNWDEYFPDFHELYEEWRDEKPENMHKVHNVYHHTKEYSAYTIKFQENPKESYREFLQRKWKSWLQEKKSKEDPIVLWLLESAAERELREKEIVEATKSSEEKTDEILIQRGLAPIHRRG